MNSIIKLSDNAAERIKEIMSQAEKDALGVRVSVKSGGCAGQLVRDQLNIVHGKLAYSSC